jgi:hypothetical protein
MMLTRDSFDHRSSQSAERLDSEGPSDTTPTRRFLGELVPIALCIVVGLMMALLPTLVQWFKLGNFIWIGHVDELFYLAVSSQAYFNHPAYLSDPVLVSGGTSLFRQLPLLPGVWIAWILSLGPLGIDGCWRIAAGVSLAVSWYLLIREFVPNRWMVAALVIILLVDCGQPSTALLFRQVQAFARLVTRSPHLMSGPFIHAQWRVPTPALTLSFLLLNLWLVSRARRKPTGWSLALSGVSFGLVFHVYPYFWTAAAAALVFAFLIDRGHRRVYLWTSLIGGLIGSYRIFYDIMLKLSTSPDWLIRTDKFVHVSRLADLKLPILAGLILVVGFVWIWKQRRELIYVWTMGLSGYVLFKHGVLTGLDIENYHWMYVWAPCCSLLLLLMVVAILPREGPRARVALMGVMVVGLADAGMGLCLRVAESLQSQAGLELVQSWHEYQTQRIDSGARRFVPNATAAGEFQFTNFAAIIENQRPLDNYWVFLSPQVTDAEWDERVALNSFLLAEDRVTYEAEQRTGFQVNSAKGGWGPWTRDAAVAAHRVRSRLAAFDQVVTDPEAALNRYRVRYLGIRTGQPPPAYVIQRQWTRVQEGPFWQVWERPASSPR